MINVTERARVVEREGVDEENLEKLMISKQSLLLDR